MSDKVKPEDFNKLFKAANEVSNSAFDKVGEAGAALILDTLKEPGLTGRAETAHAAAMEKFENGDWYSVGDDCEELTHTDMYECIGMHFDDTMESDKHIKIQCDELAPLKVFSWAKKELPTSFGFGESAIDSMLEGFDEDYWCEEYGNSFNEGSPPWDKEQLAIVKKKLYATMQECVEMAHIWQCEVSGSKEFSVEDLEEFAKLNYPKEWAEKE